MSIIAEHGALAIVSALAAALYLVWAVHRLYMALGSCPQCAHRLHRSVDICGQCGCRRSEYQVRKRGDRTPTSH
jgi:hypothetical protein